MKRFTFFLGLIALLPVFIQAQTVITFHENFELPSLDDSVTSTMVASPGVKDWGISTKLYYTGGSRSDTCQVKTGSITYLTTSSFSTLGNSNVILKFAQICKVDFTDKATIEVSGDGGTTWNQLTGIHYMGTGQFSTNGNSFSANSYGGLWIPSIPSQKPNNSWWKVEEFDISVFAANKASVKVRFKLSDAGTPGPNNNYGWLIDEIKAIMAPSELIPPVITLVNPPTGTIFFTGPFQIKAKITDASGIDTAYIVYTINGGIADTVGMNPTTADTLIGFIPVVNDSDQVCFFVRAIDGSPAENTSRAPATNCNSFTAYAGITFPFFDNFDAFDIWTPSGGGSTSWQRGTPTYGTTNSAHSAPNAWDVNLTSAYQASANCTLLSPVFDFSQAVNARLAFWINYNTENGWDGTRMEYSSNGTNWFLLGGLNDPLGENWYTGSMSSASSSPGWEGASGGWIKAKYKLSLLNNISPTVRFRYIFTSDGGGQVDGFSIDDFSITLPAPQEIAINSIITPVSGCGLGQETVKIDMINTGLTTISGGLTASYRKGNGPIVTEPVTGVIAMGDTLEYTFITPVNLLVGQADSNFTIKAWVTLNGDPTHFDDTTSRVITSKYVPVPPTVTNASIPYGTSTTITAVSPNPVTWYSVPTGGTPIGTNAAYTTGPLYGTTIYYVNATAPNGCQGPRAQDTVFVGNPPPYDGSALILYSPNTGFNLTNSQPVILKIRNYGTQPIVNFPLTYKINTNTPVTEIVSQTVPPGDTLVYTFNQTANLAAYQTYDFKAWISITGDANHVNDTVTKQVINNMFTYCGSGATSTGDDDIGNVTISNINNGNAVPQTSNPTSINTYSNFTTSVAPIVLAKGQSYPISVTSIFLGGTYNNCVKVFIDYNYNGQFEPATETAFSSGPVTAGSHTGTITVPTNAVTGYTRFRVVLVETTSQSSVEPCNTYTWGETEDYTALLIPQIPHDAAITAILQPGVVYPENYTAPVQVRLKNYGLDPITSLNVNYKLDNNPPVTLPWTGNLVPGADVVVTFPSVIWTAGSHSICAYPTFAGDSNNFNDTICGTFTGIPVDTLPYYNNFDGTDPQDFTNTGTGGTNWIHGTPNATAFPTQGPASPTKIWATNLNISGGYTDNASCALTTQIFDFTPAFNARIKFKYTMKTDNGNDGVRVQYSTDAGANWQNLGVQNDPLGVNWNPSNIASQGPGWSGTSTTWKEAKFKLSAFNYAPTLRFRFLFTSNGWTTNDGFAIDDFSITIPCHKDLGVDTIYEPSIPESTAGVPQTVKVRIVNYGIDTIQSIPVSYKIGNQPIVTEIFSPPGVGLLPDAKIDYTFVTPFNAPQGSYTLKTFTSYTDDCDHLNDTTMKQLLGIPTYVVPFIDNFDSPNLYTEWYTYGTNWEHGVVTASTINAPFSAPNCYKTKLNGIYVKNNTTDYLYSPMFDVSQGLDTLKFKHWVHIYQNDYGRIEYLSSTGWKTLGFMGDPNASNWYTTGAPGFNGQGGVPGWHESTYDLKIVQDFAIPTQFRFVFQCLYTNSTWDGWAIDDFELTTPKIPIDAGVTAITNPSGSTVYGTDLNVTVTIKNFGTDPLNTIPLKFQINGITVGVGTWTGNLDPDQTTTFTFPPYPSPLANYTICAYTDLAFDSHFSNDTTCAYITVSPPDYDVAVIDIIEPVSQTILFNEATVKVRIKNFGLNPVTDVPLGYSVAGTPTGSETWTGGPLNTGDEAEFTFAQKYSFGFTGYYYLCAYTDMSTDGYRKNDTICEKIEEKFTAIGEIDEFGVGLSQNTPNPADDMTQILYQLPKPGEVEFTLANYLGQVVLNQTSKGSKGENKIELQTGKMPAGLYYYTITFDGRKYLRKMLVTH